MGKYSTVLFFSEDLSTPFIYNEVELFSKNFDRVIIVTTDIKAKRPVISNVEIFVVEMFSYKTKKVIFNNFFSFSYLSLIEFFSSTIYIFKPKLFIQTLSSLLRCFYRAEIIEQRVLNNFREIERTLFFSFWFNDWATTLSVLKRRKTISEYFVRAHGIDLYEERIKPLKRIPFRKFQLKYVDKVFSVSQKGSDYLKEKYPLYKCKIFTSYLGSLGGECSSIVKSMTFTIVSCAKIRNIKRLYLIPEILKHIDFPLRWIHIGSENANDPTLLLLSENISLLRQSNKNIDISFIGNLSNQDVLKFYSENSINLFISVSETEGLPVSMMEAISCGIPILSTNVGGCSEIVNEKTGILIPENIDSKSVALAITEFRNSEMNTPLFREKIREFWKENFNSTSNFQRFLKLIEN